MVRPPVAGTGRLIALAAMLTAVLTAVGQNPAGAAVTAVNGSAYGYQLKASIFGSTVNTRGFGQVACTAPNTPSGCAPIPVGFLESLGCAPSVRWQRVPDRRRWRGWGDQPRHVLLLDPTHRQYAGDHWTEWVGDQLDRHRRSRYVGE